MSWYAAEQLARQRREQMIQEARGRHLVHLAGGVPPTGSLRIGLRPYQRLRSLLRPFVGAVPAADSGSMRRSGSAKKMPIDRRVIGSRDA